jgi:polysaccharide biosynthesis/export protein
MKLRAYLTGLLLLIGSPALAQQTVVPAAVPGDVVRLVVWRAPEFSGDFPVGADGTILHPLLNQVQVAGVPMEQVRASIAQVLRQFETEPRFVFSLLHRVAVTGEARIPGLYPLPAETTISQAVAAAGGATEFAVKGRVRLLRGNTERVIDLRAADPSVDVRIQPGDRIEVPRESNLLRDVIAPVASVLGAFAALASVVF